MSMLVHLIKHKIPENHENMTIWYIQRNWHSKERMVLESDSVDLDDVKFGGLEMDSRESTTRLSSPDSSRQSVSQDSGVVSDIDVKDYDNSTTISNDPTTSNTNTNNKTN